MHDTHAPGIQPDPATDILLFRSARFSSYTFVQVKSGTDICVQQREDRTLRYYLLHWSERPGGLNECMAISEECAIRLLRGLAAMPDTLPGMEYPNILKYLPGFFKYEQSSDCEDEKNPPGIFEGKERSLGVTYVL